MTICLFLGPSLDSAEAESHCPGAILLPPVRQGAVYQAVQRHRPRAIGIVDGYFQQVPAVWHKELLWAMTQGVHLYGAASMGALRAAELADSGMCGVGVIFRAYRDACLPDWNGVFEDDDEVAVVHGPAELDYRPVSEALVNIRCTLAAAARDGVISRRSRDRLAGWMKALYYPERNYQRLLADGIAAGVPEHQLAALQRWLPRGRIDRKRLDALALLECLRQLSPEPLQVDYRFEETTLWQRGIRESTPMPLDDADQAVLGELRLAGPAAYRPVLLAALLRHLAQVEHADQYGEDEPEGLRQAFDGFRRAHGLLRREQLERWLSANACDHAELENLLNSQVRLDRLLRERRDQLPSRMIDELRLRGEYPRLLERARDKQRHPGASPIDGTLSVRVLYWYFKNRLEQPMPDALEDWLAELDFANQDVFLRELIREWHYLGAIGMR